MSDNDWICLFFLFLGELFLKVTLNSLFLTSAPVFSLSGRLPVFSLPLCACRSSASSKFWRGPSLHSRAWSFLHGWAEARPPNGERGTKVKRRSKRRRLRLQPKILSPTTASPQPGPMKSVSHDLLNNFLDCWHSCLKWYGRLILVIAFMSQLCITLAGSVREVGTRHDTP